ncbi:hypothetical protein D9M69_524010 [compost metagenome]
MITVARGANHIAHTKKTRRRIPPPIIKKSFFRKSLKFGTFLFGFFTLGRAASTAALGTARFVNASSFVMSPTALSSEGSPAADLASAVRARSPTGKLEPSITSSPSSISSALISAISGLL